MRDDAASGSGEWTSGAAEPGQSRTDEADVVELDRPLEATPRSGSVAAQGARRTGDRGHDVSRVQPAPRGLGHLLAGQRTDDVRKALEVVQAQVVQLDLAHDRGRAFVGLQLARQAAEQTADAVCLLGGRRPVVAEALQLDVDAAQRLVEIARVDAGPQQPAPRP